MKPISPKEAQQMFQGTTDGWVEGTVMEPVGGRYAYFRRGERILARKQSPKYRVIQRRRWRGSLVPLCNVLAGVHVKFLNLNA